VAAGDEGVIVLDPYRPIPHLEPWARERVLVVLRYGQQRIEQELAI
jgi:hypothetical protein